MNVLFLLHPGDNSRAHMIDLIKGFESAGHRALVWDIADAAAAIRAEPAAADAIRARVSDELQQLIQQHRVELSVGMWANALMVTENRDVAGRATTFFERVSCPHLMIWYDAPDRAHNNELRPLFDQRFFDSPFLFHAINNAATAREMVDIHCFGQNVFPHAYGINPEIFKPMSTPRRYDIIFNSNGGNWESAPAWAAAELAGPDPDMFKLRRTVAAEQRPRRHAIPQHFPPAVRDAATELMEILAESQITSRSVPMLTRIDDLCQRADPVGRAAAALRDDPELYATVTNQIRMIDEYERAFVFTHLSHYFNCGLFGSVDYASLGCRVRTIGHVQHHEQAAIYNQGRIGLSVMRWQDEAGYHIKPFEITACGIPCLAARRSDTESLFDDGSEIVTFDSLPITRQKIATLLADEATLSAIATAGRCRTLRQHTAAHWASAMVTAIQSMRRTSCPVA